MHLPFDILKKERDGSFRWFEAVTDRGLRTFALEK